MYHGTDRRALGPTDAFCMRGWAAPRNLEDGSSLQSMLFPSPRPSAASARVVVTGAGIVTALGAGWKANAEGFKTGRRAFSPVSVFDVSRQRVKTAAQVEWPLALPPTKLTARQLGRLDRA